MENKEEIKRIDGKYFLIRELETNGEPINVDGEMLQPIKPINDDDDYDCQHCSLYETDDCGEPCSGGFFVRVLPENSEEKIDEKLSNMEITGKDLEPEKEKTTMERKIGEIFEDNGEWYQCIEGAWCRRCDFHRPNLDATQCNHYPRCMATKRSDHKSVTFKKLEKVGEPFSDYCPSGRVIYFQSYKCYQKPIYTGNMIYWADDITISIEIKQTKEDMEENELIELLSEKVHNAWMKEKEAQGFSYGKEYDKEKKKHPDMLPYNKLKEEVKEYDRATVKAVLQAQKELSADVNKLNLKPFSIEAAKAGKPVCTRDGRKARIICFDKQNDYYPIIALVTVDEKECVFQYTNKGEYLDGNDNTRCNDLMMLPEKKEGWVNVYKRGNEYICENECSVSTGITVYKSESEAKRNIDEDKICVNTIKITWEE